METDKRKLRRVALLLNPDITNNDETIKQIADEGYTDVSAGMVLIGNRWGWILPECRELADRAEKYGLGMIAFTGFMKYNEHVLAEQPERSFVTYGIGDKLDSDGLPSRWMCPFQPENKEYYIKSLKEIASWPAMREIHLNDEAALGLGNNSIGCYCKYCTEKFKSLTGSEPPKTPDWKDPLWWDWIEYRMDEWVAIHSELRDEVKKINPDIMAGIQHSPLPATFTQKPWVAAISLARDARALDLLATDPYHFIHFPLIPYRPHRRILSEATRALVGACIDREAGIYPQAFQPPTSSTPLTRHDGILAGVVPFALGANTITPYAYELCKIIPGFFEGFQDAAKLMPQIAKSAPYSSVTVIKPHQSEIRGHAETDFGKDYLGYIADVMYCTGLPWKWFWDERLDDAGDQLKGPLIVPEAHCLTEQQIGAINKVAQRGEGVLWIGNMPQQPWSGRGPCPLPTEFEIGHGFELKLNDNQKVFDDITDPVYLKSRAGGNGPDGNVVATIDGKPALVLMNEGENRQAWLAGVPFHSYNPPVGYHGAQKVPTHSMKLWKQLLDWLAPKKPLVRFELHQTDYSIIRPWDIRGVPTMEMFPLVSEDAVLAIIYPHVRCAFKGELIFNPPEGTKMVSAVDLWKDKDLTNQVEQIDDGELHLPLDLPGDFELLAVRLGFE